MHESKNIALICGKLRSLARPLAEMPGRAADAATVNRLLAAFEGKETPGSDPRGRSIELSEIASALVKVRGATEVLEEIHKARAGGLN